MLFDPSPPLRAGVKKKPHPPGSTITSLTIVPSQVTVDTGGVALATVTARNFKGTVIALPALTILVDNPSITSAVIVGPRRSDRRCSL